MCDVFVCVYTIIIIVILPLTIRAHNSNHQVMLVNTFSPTLLILQILFSYLPAY